jgi:hypothetical protein
LGVVETKWAAMVETALIVRGAGLAKPYTPRTTANAGSTTAVAAAALPVPLAGLAAAPTAAGATTAVAATALPVPLAGLAPALTAPRGGSSLTDA